MRHAAILGSVLVAAASAPATASGATWSPPLNVSSPATFITSPFIGFARSGDGLALWGWMNGVGPTARSWVRLAKVAPAGTFSPEQPAPRGVASPVIYGNGRVVAVDVVEIFRRGRPPLGRVRVSFGRVDGRFTRPKTIDTIRPFRLPAIAANAHGRLAVAYMQLRGDGRRMVTLAVRRGKRFGRPRIVSARGDFRSVTVAVGPRGDVIIAWARGRVVEARIQRPGRPLGPIVRVGRIGTARAIPTLRAAIAASGRAWVGWSAQALTEGGDNGPFTLRVAVSSPAGSRFGSPTLLDRYQRRASDEATFDLALDGRQGGLVAWSTFDGRNFRARAGFANPRGRFLRKATLSRPGYDAAVGDLTTSGRVGEALVAWSRLDDVGEVGTSVLATYIDPQRRSGAEEQVSRGDRARAPMAAFNPRGGLPTIVWSQREGPDEPGVPLGRVRTFLKAATRTL